MGLTMKEKKAISKEVAKRYRNEKKKRKGMMLDEFIQTTGYNRCYASWVLSNWGREIGRYLKNGDKLVLVKDPKVKKKRTRPRFYDQNVLAVLKNVWKILSYPCGKRLGSFLQGDSAGLREAPGNCRGPCHPGKSPSGKRRHHRQNPERRKEEMAGQRNSNHRSPRTLLKSQIPIRTFSEWNENKRGLY